MRRNVAGYRRSHAGPSGPARPPLLVRDRLLRLRHRGRPRHLRRQRGALPPERQGDLLGHSTLAQV